MDAMSRHEQGLAIQRRVRESMGPEELQLILEASGRLPEDWRRVPAERGFEFLRSRLRFTQCELARKSGVAQAQISRLEGGGDALLSTWRRLYAAMGFELLLVPLTAMSIDELDARADAGRPEGHWRRTRAKPRRRRMKERAQEPA